MRIGRVVGHALRHPDSLLSLYPPPRAQRPPPPKPPGFEAALRQSIITSYVCVNQACSLGIYPCGNTAEAVLREENCLVMGCQDTVMAASLSQPDIPKGIYKSFDDDSFSNIVELIFHAADDFIFGILRACVVRCFIDGSPGEGKGDTLAWKSLESPGTPVEEWRGPPPQSYKGYNGLMDLLKQFINESSVSNSAFGMDSGYASQPVNLPFI
eukprot:1155613-Pelagomonas_calceolata.AAC.6